MDIIENFLTKEDFDALSAVVTSINFPWHFSENYVNENEKKPSPGVLFHSIYFDKTPRSPFYDSSFLPVVKALNAIVLYRIRINRTFRLSEAYFSDFHGDMQDITAPTQQDQWTTSILYINTNNGYTEFEDGQRIESVANRLGSFPASTKHRVVTQTDEQTRIVVNFNYLKVDTAYWETIMGSHDVKT